MPLGTTIRFLGRNLAASARLYSASTMLKSGFHNSNRLTHLSHGLASVSSHPPNPDACQWNMIF